MKSLLTISFLFLLTPGFSQEEAAALAKRLTATHTTELGKVTAIFHWITDNISYKPHTQNRKVIGTASRRNFKVEEEDDSPLKPLNERVTETVLKKRVAICDGYARLFTTLCDHAGIRSEIIVGYASNGRSRSLHRFAVNHYWNAVMIDGKWYLLDATWASGYLSSGGDEFIRDYDPHYFLTAPEVFIRDHYPDDARWLLLADPGLPEEFRRSPFKQKSFTKYNITSFYPASGVIETFVGDTIRLRVETALSELERDICPDLQMDTAIFSHSSTWVFLRPTGPGNPIALSDNRRIGSAVNSEYHYTYTVASPDVEWLYLIYNDDLVLRYKINVKKKRS